MPETQAEPRLTEEQLMAALGIKSQRTMTGWRKKGCPTLKLGGRWWYYESKVRAWMDENGRTGVQGRPPARLEDELEHAEGDIFEERRIIKKHYEMARLRKEIALAQKYEMDRMLREGEVLLKADVERDSLNRIHACKANLLALPGKLAPRLAHRSAVDIHRELEAELWAILEEYARGYEHALKEKKTG